MKKLMCCILALLGLVSCGEKPDDPIIVALDVTGAWELTSVSTKASVGSVPVSVYVEFAEGGTFSLYQKIGEGRYSAFTGNWRLTDNEILSGSYSDGTAWGPYTAAVAGSNLTLASSGGKEVDTYKKIASIPESVTSNTY